MTALVVVLVVFVFLLGAAIGSFLNVVIYRVPLGLSIVRPGSRCPACDAPVRVVHNLPIAGWLLLRGRCARCGVQISARYPLIELAMGLLAVAVFASFAAGHLSEASLRSGRALFEVGIPTLLYGGFAALMLALAFIDLDWFVLPDGMTLPAIPLGVLTAWAAGGAAGVTVYDALIGAGVGAGVFLVIGLTYGLLTGRMGLGGGDWKLLAAIGAFLGWSALPFVLAAGAVQGLVFAVAFRRSFAVALLPPDPRDVLDAGDPAHAPIATEAGAGDALAAPEIPAPEPADAADVPFRQLAVPFGPFLGLAAIEMLLFRDELRALLGPLLGRSG